MACELAYVGNDNVIQLKGLTDVDGNYINDATVTLTTVEDDEGTEVTGMAFPVSMPYVAASDGIYRATLQDGVNLVDKGNYVATIDVDATSEGLQAHWEIDFVARTRTK